MTTLLYHGHTIGPICRRIAAASDGHVQALSDREHLPAKLDGALVRWDSRAAMRADRDINPREAVLLSRNKKESRLALGALAPRTWIWYGDLNYPCLIRPKRHYAAHKFFVCQNALEARRAIRQCGRRRWYASPIINKEQEYRIFAFQDHAIKVVRRFHDNPQEVAWNIANGGRSVRVKHDSWPLPSVKATILAGRALGLGWYAADVIVDAQGKSFVLEANTAPGLDRDNTIKHFAELFSWAGTHEPPPANNLEGDTWEDLIHPALL